MAGTMDLTRLLIAIANLEHKAAVDLLSATQPLATARRTASIPWRRLRNCKREI